MKRCSKCGSTNVVEREPKNGRKRWICKCCEYKMIEKIKIKNNASYTLKDDPEPNKEVSSYYEMFPKITDDFSDFIASFKNDSSKRNTTLVFILTISFILVAIISFNIGKNVSIDRTWLSKKSEYQEVIQAYTEANIKLPKLRKEIVSNSDLVAELRDYKKKYKEKHSEISSLTNQVAELTKEKDDLKEQVADLTKEKELLTGEIAKAKGKGYTLTAGKYIGGEDIPTGTYNIIWVSGSGNVFVGRQVNEIFGNNSRYGYIKTYKNAEVDYLTEIEIHGNVKVKFKAKD